MGESYSDVVHCAKDLLALRQQIDQLQQHISLLMMESAIIQERRCLLQRQRDITPPADVEITQRLEITCGESVDDFLDMGGSHMDSASGLSFALEGVQGFSGVYPYSGSSAVILSDHSVVVETQLRPQSSASKLRAKLRDLRAAHRRLQSRTVQYEPPALFQGLVEYL